MCGICGCSDIVHSHNHDKDMILVEESVFAKNNQYADLNNKYLTENNVIALNLMSSPGAGKTTLLGKTFLDLNNKINMSVIVGDQQSFEDANQLRLTGLHATQVNTGKVCHLDAHMVGHALEKIPKQNNQLLFIENIGNLVCPAFFNLGEHYKVVILSVTEGDNKPIKYPEMFRCADLVLITKIDLLPYVDFSLQRCIDYVRQIKSDIDILPISAKNMDGLGSWYNWLSTKRL